MKPKLIIFASGTKDGGGSGFENLVNQKQLGILDADIVAVISNYEHGGVRERADRLGIPFIHFIETYQKIVHDTGAEWVALSGWLKLVADIDPKRTFNIHPGPLPKFGGKEMYGHYVHEAVMDAYRRGEITHSAVTMHFVTKNYDEGPIFFRYPVEIKPDDTAETLGTRVNAAEHHWQPFITNLVVHEVIRWDGNDPKSLVVPAHFTLL